MPRVCYVGGMQKEHPLDRLGRKLQTPLIWSLWVSGPIAVFTYGKAIIAYAWTLPGWLTFIVVLSHIVMFVGVASLIDRQQARRQSSESGQSAPPQPMRRADPR